MSSEIVVVARAVKEHLNKWPDKPVGEIKTEDLEKDLMMSMAIQPLAGNASEKKYIDGTRVVVWPFSVYVRIIGSDENEMFDAIACLCGLDDWLQSNDLPDLGENREVQKLEMVTHPSIAASYDDGTRDYQAIFNLTYKTRR